jgi:hypothetical protein
MEDNHELIKILLIELIEELGGTIELDARKISEDVAQNKFKSIGVRVANGIVTVEVVDED